MLSGYGEDFRKVEDFNNIELYSNTNYGNEWYYNISKYQLQLRDEMVFSKTNFSNAILGKSYLNLFTFFIPRSVLGDYKPRFLDSYTSEEFWYIENIGLPLNIYGESYFNFYIFGFFIFIIIGAFAAKITNLITRYKNDYLVLIFIIIMTLLQFWSTTNFVYVLQLLFIFYISNLIFRFVKN